ncbi:VCBS repeat-containing protein [Planomonospora sp. ID67723]|uniref:FG-GAP repeat domain-containing protein n=1 Tax=Planomonospora sp. ID67723 TaxID=2738134 RepID=UPI0018C3C929|nr:VCBS repeat-containing protein [Planomonospora sp. ID67723]MBG0828704.1 VCBS repeat-containing protein [Planomonospora sp. ID67723]
MDTDSPRTSSTTALPASRLRPLIVLTALVGGLLAGGTGTAAAQTPSPDPTAGTGSAQIPSPDPTGRIPGPAGPPVPPELAAAIAYAQCVPGGPTSGDTAVANRVRPQMNGPRLGRSVNAYNVSCARIITSTTKGRGLDKRAAVIAVTTAITESTLHNYTQAVDHDSLGLFQQRPSQGWGTPAQLVDPVYATNAFLNAMLRKFPNNSWMSGDIGAICQKVQVSAVPSAYAREVHDAQLLVDALWSGSPDLGVLNFHLSDSQTSNVETRPVINYGNSPMIPIRGDWDGDGKDTVSAYDPTSGRFYISNNPASGQHEYAFMYGNPNAVPLVGDWDGDGKDNVGVRMGITFYLRTSPVTSGTETTQSVAYGDGPMIPAVGDWDGDGKDTVSAYDPRSGRFYISNNPASGQHEYAFMYGNPNAVPLVGDWDGDGKDNVGVRMGNTFYLRTSPVTTGTETTHAVAYGDGTDLPITGDWDGDGKASQGVVR